MNKKLLLSVLFYANTIIPFSSYYNLIEKFYDITGNLEAKKILCGIVKNIKNNTQTGSKQTVGILFSGKPGAHKALFAKALAGESSCSLITCSSSDFIKNNVNGVHVIKEVFKAAIAENVYAKCIIFIDEIDKLTCKQISDGSKSSEKYNKIIKQLLIEIDEFKKNKNKIIVICGINNIKSFCESTLLLKKFDETINISIPEQKTTECSNEKSREEFLNIYLKKISYDPNLNISKIVSATNGFLEKDIETLVDKAYLISFSKYKQFVDISDFQEAFYNDDNTSTNATEKNLFKIVQAGTIKENFSNVAGNYEAKKNILDILKYIKNPKQFNEIGAFPPRGILLTGNPGTGKTLLALALAGEANCSFISCTGSDFSGKYIGDGVSLVKMLFKSARKEFGPCIIFIDEIDSLAFKRLSGRSSSAASTCYNQTINQLLTEMDGFKKNTNPIIIIGATNHPESLDEAILRPGRFDRIVHIPMPDSICRKEILNVHLKKIKHDPSLNISKISQETSGFSGADLANLVNEAAIIALNKNKNIVDMSDFKEAQNKINKSNLSKNNSFQILQPGTIKENFSNVAGNNVAKKNLIDILNYLKNPQKFKEIGAIPPKGILLTGNPGTGKTLLARALAGEANCTFISCTGSEFVGKYIGDGVANVKELFNTARENSGGPCIIFIDEIDALAFKRISDGSSTSTHYNQTINQLLTEMDGFNSNKEPIIVIGATNHPKYLDNAILRPGRFDRIIHIDMPDVIGRKEILNVHLKKIKYDQNINILKIAQETPNFSGADLANLVNEAAIIALNKDKNIVDMSDFKEAIKKIIFEKKG